MSMGALIKASVVQGHAVEARRVALEWIALCAADSQKAIFCAVDGALELAGVSGSISAEDVQGDPGPFLEQLPEWVREKNLDLMSYSFSTHGGKHGKRSSFYWERFWALGVGSQNVGDVLDLKLPELLERWFIPMTHHGIRTVRHVGTVAVLSIAQALGHHLREQTKQLDTIRHQLESGGGAKQKQASKLDEEMQLLEERVKTLSAHRLRLVENVMAHRNRDLCEVIRLHTLVEVEKLMKQEPGMYLQQKWTARVFLMVHDQSADVRLRALSCIASWFEKLNTHRDEVKEHLLQFAERCMLHIVDRSRDTDSRVACRAIQMLRLPVLAERMTDEEVERVVNLVSMGTEVEVRQEAALFVNAQVFQDPGICVPEGRSRRKRPRASHATRDRERDENLSDLSDAGEHEDDAGEREERAPDNVATLLNSETSISMFIEFLENYMGSSLRLTDRAVNAFWHKAPCLSHWHTMVSLMILGEGNKGPGIDPVSTRQRLILIHVMEAAVRRATEDVKKAAISGVREKDASAKMDAACTTIVPELPRLFELCHPEEKQVLIVSHICKMLIDHAESRHLKDVIWNARSLGKVLRQCILNQGFTDVVKHCTDSLLVISVFITEVKAQFIEVAKRVHDETVAACKAMTEGLESQRSEDLRSLLGKFNVINQRGIDMSFGNHECLNVFFNLLDARVNSMRKWQDHCKQGLIEDQGFQFPASMPDTGHTIYLLENCMGVTSWYFRFCHWEHHSPGSAAVQELDTLQATRIKETRSMLPKVFLEVRNKLCDIIDTDGSPIVKLVAFSSYMAIMQVAVGVSEGMDVEGGSEAHPLPPGHVLKGVEDLKKFRMPEIRPEHQKVLFQYLSDLFSQVQGSHAVRFDDEGQKVEPHDIWPPLGLRGQYTSPRYMLQELIEGRTDTTRANDFEAEDGDRGPQQQLLRAIIGARMVLESEIEDVHAGPIGQLVLTQLDRSKPKPLRDVALKLKRRLRDLARISTEFAEQYFETQKAAVVGLYDQVGVKAAESMALEFARQWGPRIMPWLEKPLFDTLMTIVNECGQRGAQGLPLLEAFSFWIKGDEFVTESRRTALKEKALQVFEAHGVSTSGDSAKGLQRFIQRCESHFLAPLQPAAEAGETMDPATEPRPAATPLSIGRRIRGKQTVSLEGQTAADDAPATDAEASTARKKPRTGSRTR
jgi:hypothetical protein